MTLLLIGAVAGFLASDYIRASRMQRRIGDYQSAFLAAMQNVEHRIESVIASSSLMSAGDVYREARLLARRAERTVRATSFGDGGERLSGYLEALAERARTCTDEGRPFSYKVVVPPSCPDDGSSQPSKSVQDRIDERVQAFSNSRALHRLDIRELKEGPPWRTDFLIVDDKHALIAFLQHHSGEIQHAIAILNNPTVVGPIADWYDGLFLTATVAAPRLDKP
jgi:hypothetical protein